MLKLADLPGWLRKTIKIVYPAWVLLLTVFGAFLAFNTLFFEHGVNLTFEIVLLLAGLVVAPVTPFAQRLFFPGGGGMDFNAEYMRDAGRTAEAGIGDADTQLPELGFLEKSERPGE